jgi:hypothetical protein
MDDWTRASAERACERLILHLAHLTDHGPHAEIAQLFTADGEFDRDGTVLHGREALRAFYAKRPASLLTRHVVSNITVDVHDEHHATSRAYGTVFRCRSQDANAPVLPAGCDGPESMGEYHDHLVHTPEGWRLKRRVLRTVILCKAPST